MGRKGEFDLTGGGHFQGVTQKAEAGDVGDGMHRQVLQAGLGQPVQGRHDPDGLGLGLRGGQAPFHGRGNDAGSQGLGEDQLIAHPGPAVGEHPVRMDHAGDGEAVFQFRIIDAVAAHEQGPGLVNLVQAAGQNRLEHLWGTVLLG